MIAARLQHPAAARGRGPLAARALPLQPRPAWAWAIVATTIVVRIVLVPLTVRQITRCSRSRARAGDEGDPRKYKGDRQKLNEELMKFYRENTSTRPPRACRCWRSSRSSSRSTSCSELREARARRARLVAAHRPEHRREGRLALVGLPAARDLRRRARSLSTYFMSTTMDKAQRTMMMIVPLDLHPVVAHFPAGLVLYWVTTNLWTVGQGLITRGWCRRRRRRRGRSARRERRQRLAATAPKRERRSRPAAAAAPKPRAAAAAPAGQAEEGRRAAMSGS